MSEKHKGGRPSKYPTIDLDKVEQYAALGLIEEEIAMLLDISLRTLAVYKDKPEFLHAIKRGKLHADSTVVKRLFDKTKAGDTTAMIFWLKNRRSSHWRDKQDHHIEGEIEHTGTVMFMPRPKKKVEKKD